MLLRSTEYFILTIDVRQKQKDLRGQLNRLLRHEELKGLQRCTEKEIIEGDSNTRYYQAKANGGALLPVWSKMSRELLGKIIS